MANGAYEKSKRYIEFHTEKPDKPFVKKEVYPCITISRQTGAGQNQFAKSLFR